MERGSSAKALAKVPRKRIELESQTMPGEENGFGPMKKSREARNSGRQQGRERVSKMYSGQGEG